MTMIYILTTLPLFLLYLLSIVNSPPHYLSPPPSWVKSLLYDLEKKYLLLKLVLPSQGKNYFFRLSFKPFTSGTLIAITIVYYDFCLYVCSLEPFYKWKTYLCFLTFFILSLLCLGQYQPHKFNKYFLMSWLSEWLLFHNCKVPFQFKYWWIRSIDGYSDPLIFFMTVLDTSNLFHQKLNEGNTMNLENCFVYIAILEQAIHTTTNLKGHKILWKINFSSKL